MIIDRFPAMGTEVVARGSSSVGLDAVRRFFSEVEACCSRFRPDSELSRLNRSGGVTPVSPLLGSVLRAAAAMERRTDGLVDAGVGATVAAWGYDRSFEHVTGLDSAPPPSPLAWSIEGDAVERSPGTKLDLGGIAKGWSCDAAVERGWAHLVSAGGDLRSSATDTVVEVKAPDGSLVARVDLGVGALATSSSGRRRWLVGDREVSHLIDPRTGEPVVSPVVSATVSAATAVEAEAGAKAVLILGESGLAWAARQSWIRAALVVWRDGTAYATRDWELAA